MDEVKRQDRFLRQFLDLEDALRGFVRSLVPTGEDAREVMQETAAVLWRKFNEADSPEDFRRWAFGVARFEALAFLRDRARDRHVFSEGLTELLAREAEAAAAIADAEAEALEGCLRKLPTAQRTLIDAAYAGGQEIKNLARDAGRTPMAVYKALQRIRSTLLECVRRKLSQESRA